MQAEFDFLFFEVMADEYAVQAGFICHALFILSVVLSSG